MIKTLDQHSGANKKTNFCNILHNFLAFLPFFTFLHFHEEAPVLNIRQVAYLPVWFICVLLFPNYLKYTLQLTCVCVLVLLKYSYIYFSTKNIEKHILTPFRVSSTQKLFEIYNTPMARDTPTCIPIVNCNKITNVRSILLKLGQMHTFIS